MNEQSPSMGVADGEVSGCAHPESAVRRRLSYEDRKLSGLCTVNACKSLAEDGYQFCSRHRELRNRRKRRRQRVLRAELSSAGKCIGCRKPSQTYRCPACRIRDRTNLPSRSEAKSEVSDPFRRDNDGWARYRGKGKRGAPPQADIDADDLASALSELERGRQALIYAHSEPVKKIGRHAHRDAKAAAAGILALAAGFIAEVVQRNDPERAKSIAELRADIGDPGEEE